MQQGKIPLIVVAGPTASGKTSLAIEICREYRGEVVSADSMQIYKQMNIGTAKPTKEEMGSVKHHMLDIVSPSEMFSVADYTNMAHEKITELHSNNIMPVLAGGTGLYISSVVDNITFSENETDDNLRKSLYDIAKENGNEYLHSMLEKIDPEIAQTLHPNNLGRVVRAIEVFKLTGKTMTQTQKESKSNPSNYFPIMIALTCKDRALLYDRINKRVDIMIESGLIEETEKLISNGFSKTAFQAIGYKEIINYISGKESLENAVEKLKMETRRYAKRQLTWFRRDNRYHWIEIDTKSCYDDVKADAFSYINSLLK